MEETKIKWKEYYDSIMVPVGTEIKKKIITELGISQASFYNKSNNNSFDYKEWQTIEKITGKKFMKGEEGEEFENEPI